MSIFRETLRLESLDGERSVEMDALVDTGAFFTLVPSRLLEELGVEPFDTHAVGIADGRRVSYDIGHARATVGERSAATAVLFGDDDVEPELGSYTLAGLLLAVDPDKQRLVPLKLQMVCRPTVIPG